MPPTQAQLAVLPGARDAVRPIPPRYWWLKRCAVAAGVMLVLVGGSRWWWGWYASRALEAEIERLKAAGEPLEEADFDLPPVPDELNAAIPLKGAVAIQQKIIASKRGTTIAIDKDALAAAILVANGKIGGPEFRALADRKRALATRPEDPDAARAREASIARIRELVHQARSRSGVNWGLNAENVETASGDFIAYDWISKCLNDAVLAAHGQGDDPAALDVVEDALAMAERLSDYRILLAGMQAEVTIDRMVEDLQQILADRPGGAEAKVSAGSRPLDRERINALIHRLLDERVLREGMIWGMQRERLVQLNEIRLVTSNHADQVTGRSGPWEYGRVGLWLVKPMLQLDGVRVLRANNCWVEVCRTMNLPDAVRLAPPSPPRKEGLSAQSRLLGSILDPDFSRTQIWSLRYLARRRMAATGLAIYLYEQDRGHMPETLDELVPQYLRRIPENPMLEPGHPIQYWLHCEYPCLYAPEQQGVPPGYKHLAEVSCRFYMRGRPPERTTARPATRPFKAAS